MLPRIVAPLEMLARLALAGAVELSTDSRPARMESDGSSGCGANDLTPSTNACHSSGSSEVRKTPLTIKQLGIHHD